MVESFENETTNPLGYSYVLLESPAHRSESRLVCAAVFTNLALTPSCVCNSGVVTTVLNGVALRDNTDFSSPLHIPLIPANPAILRRRSSQPTVRRSAVRPSAAAAPGAIQSRGLSTWWSASAISRRYGRGLSATKCPPGGDVLPRRSR